ncbi:MAG: hypothetical protein KBD00_02930 [Candidatus Peribacteraceae bacterium]|nr:hypothetical protein [Candidatus Peribacteraceae bacterium]
MIIHCSGIGGIGLSAYAAHMNAAGHTVSGSDKNDSALIEDLTSQGIQVSLKQDGSAFPEGCELLVYSEAIPESAPERMEAAKRGVRQISYFKALGEMTAGTDLICVCGTHGKSSTTAMVAKMLIDAGLDPNVVVGTKMRELGGRNWRKGKGNLWVVEACEYRRSFHFLSPQTILLTNADGDHYDAYPTYEEYAQAFVEFCQKLPQEKPVIAHGNDAQSVAIVEKAGRMLLDADTQPLIPLGTPGLHMQQNAQLALALAMYVNLDGNKAIESLGGYTGTWRRMEKRGKTIAGIEIIDDYAHHPTEIRATLAALRGAYPNHRLVTVFQPHTHDRTLRLWDEFTTAFKDTDVLVLAGIYDARPDTEKAQADPIKLGNDIRTKSNCDVINASTLQEAESLLRTSVLKPNDLLIVMGAGNISKLAELMTK